MARRNQIQNNQYASPVGMTDAEQRETLQKILDIVPESVKRQAEESLSRPSRNTNNGDPYAPPDGMSDGEHRALINEILAIIPQNIRQSVDVSPLPKSSGRRRRGRRR